jgi:hypothetical protein
VLAPGPLARRYAVGMVSDGVEKRLSSSARPVGLSNGADERARRVRSHVIVTGRRERQADDVQVGERAVQDVVAARQQRLVGDRRGGRAVPAELRPPEEALVRLVPDHHVPHGRKAGERVSHVSAVIATGVVRLRRARTSDAVHRQHHLHPRRRAECPLELDHIGVGEARLARRPLERDPKSACAEVPRWLDRLCPDPLRQVLAEADEEAGVIGRRLRRGGTEEHHPRHGRDSEPSEHYNPQLLARSHRRARRRVAEKTRLLRVPRKATATPHPSPECPPVSQRVSGTVRSQSSRDGCPDLRRTKYSRPRNSSARSSGSALSRWLGPIWLA